MKNVELERRVEELERINESLRDELVGYRRIENSKVDAEEEMNRSFQSEHDGQLSGDTRKLTTQLKKLTS